MTKIRGVFMNQLQRENAEFLMEVLYNANNFRDGAYDFFVNGKDNVLGLKSLIKKIIYNKNENIKYNDTNITFWLPIIVQAMNDFLEIENFPSTPSYRQTIFEAFVDWCKEIANIYYDYDRIKEVIDDLTPPVYDPAIYLIKKMHGEGVSKKEVSAEFDVEVRTVWNNIRRLDIKNKGKVPPIRIGGQPVYVDIETTEKEDDYPTGSRYLERTYYRTPNSMHPFVMQYNVTQAMILLKSLYLYHTTEEINTVKNSEICYKMAIDAWCQLSEYGKSKILDIYGKHDPEFREFLEGIEDEACGNNIIVFEPEEVFLKENSKINADEQIHIAFKSGAVCRIIFNDRKKQTLYEQRILIDENNRFYAIPEKEITDNKVLTDTNKVYLNFEEIKQIIAE